MVKKSNKISLFYILSSVFLFLGLAFSGVYGTYISVGLNFVKSSMPSATEIGTNGVSNVSIGGTVDFTPSMSGVIILSIVLILLSIFDFINLFKQIIFFKQYRVIDELKLEKQIEKKVKSKGIVIFWTIVIDVISFIAGVAGIFINNRCFAGRRNFCWILYVVDVIIAVLSVLSMVLLIVKLKNKNSTKNENKTIKQKSNSHDSENGYKKNIDIDKIGYDLVKLKTMKEMKMISIEEYNKLRKKIMVQNNFSKFNENPKTDS